MHLSFPYISQYISSEGVTYTVHFKYKAQFLPHSLIFVREMLEENDQVFVKYTQTYSVEAHETILSSIDIAFPPAELLRPKVKQAIDALHQFDLVHGDLRDIIISILVSTDGIRRPQEAQYGNIIKKDHDIFMLNVIFPETE
ncbi:8442_t:CDS:2 [Paraglomus occultum]|uniref:8442_t:CDS:1 n=1 Tax=Paraglomus occultum TaxID=144539 RepID=A0A9N8Z479_9GLOM|nr:8442_t:CDS:2 [Paraglomus occultum]